jgi:oligopeptide transport system substrate-binding protein
VTWDRLRSGVTKAICLVFLAGACAPTTPPTADTNPAGELTTFTRTDPGSADPQWSGNVEQVTTPFKVYEGLLRADPITLAPVPAAARELPKVSQDGLTYLFTLRGGLTYSDGAPLAARDFAYALSRLCDANAPYGATFFVVVGCRDLALLDPAKESPQRVGSARDALLANGLRVKSETELEIHLTQPAGYLSSFLATWVSSPVREKDVVRGGADTWWANPSLYVGNGPFILAERITNDRFVFVANPRARVQPKLKKWTVRIGEAAVAMNAYRHDELDLFLAGTQEAGVLGSALQSDPSLAKDLKDFAPDCTTYVRFDTTRPPFDDPKFRLALAKSIDRDALLKELNDGTRAALSLIPPGQPGYDPGDSAQHFDLQTARTLLSESRYPSGLGTIHWTNNNRNQTLLIQALARQWKTNLGLDVSYELVTGAELAEAFKRAETRPPLAFLGWCWDYPDQQDWLSTLFDSEQTYIFYFPYSSKTFDSLVRQADRESDQHRRSDLYLQASRLLSSDAPAIFLRYFGNRVLEKPWVRGYTNTSFFNPQDIYVVKH